MKKTRSYKYGSRSEDFLHSRANAPPSLSPLVANGVSEYRRNVLDGQIKQGLYSDGGGATFTEGTTYNSNVVSLSKTAQMLGGEAGGGSQNWLGGGIGNTAMQIPEIYSPLWLTSNLNLPRDRATINAWCRAYFALNPIVHNAIQLHSTYPISKMNIKCADPQAQNFYNDMAEELDLVNVCVQIAQEFFCLGEAYPFADFDQSRATWSRIDILNPDFIVVKRTAISGDPIIMLRPDENLKNVVKSNRPSDVEQRKQLAPDIIDAVKRGQNIQLSNFNVSQLARRISAYEIRGTGLPVSCFKWLMLMDKEIENKFVQADTMINPMTLVKIGNDGPEGLHPTHADLEAWRAVFECHDEETEVMTDQGFKKIHDVLAEPFDAAEKPTIKSGIKIACFNRTNNELEYHTPINTSVYDYEGEMHHYLGKKIDIKVTPNHKMWVKGGGKKRNNGNEPKFGLRPSSEVIQSKDWWKFQSWANWTGKKMETVNVVGKKFPIKLFLKWLGYVVSEGCVTYHPEKYQNVIGINQATSSDAYKDIRAAFGAFADILGRKTSDQIVPSKPEKNEQEQWRAHISSVDLAPYLVQEIGDGKKCSSFEKRLPRWVLGLDTELLKILLDALVKGDGSEKTSKYGTNSHNVQYCTVSKQLCDDVYELAYKCGYVPTITTHLRKSKDNRPEYYVMWSDTNYGREPNVLSSRNYTGNGGGATATVEQYKGLVWCFEVPTGLFITRRNGKITIQGNSAQNNKDFKIFTHPGISVERVGYNNAVMDIANDLTMCIKMIYTGLQVPSVLMDGGQDTTYANGGVALDVLRQRYLQFREMMGLWLKRKIFAPIAELHGFYEMKDGKKKLILPDIEWNHMSLFDAGDYINTLTTLTTPGAEGGPPQRVSNHTLYRSLGLEFEDEQRKLRAEAIANAIFLKEQAALTAMPLSELRALDPDEDIPEAEGTGEAPLPGEAPPGEGLPGMLPTPPSGGAGAPPPPPSGGGPAGGLPGLGGPPAPASEGAPPPPPGPAPGAPPAPPPPK